MQQQAIQPTNQPRHITAMQLFDSLQLNQNPTTKTHQSIYDMEPNQIPMK
jgi:hypothetical protein